MGKAQVLDTLAQNTLHVGSRFVKKVSTAAEGITRTVPKLGTKVADAAGAGIRTASKAMSSTALQTSAKVATSAGIVTVGGLAVAKGVQYGGQSVASGVDAILASVGRESDAARATRAIDNARSWQAINRDQIDIAKQYLELSRQGTGVPFATFGEFATNTDAPVDGDQQPKSGFGVGTVAGASVAALLIGGLAVFALSKRK